MSSNSGIHPAGLPVVELRGDPGQAPLQVGQHELQGFGPLLLGVELGLDGVGAAAAPGVLDLSFLHVHPGHKQAQRLTAARGRTHLRALTDKQPNPWQHDSEANNSSESNKPSKDDFLMKYLEKMKSDLKNDQTLLTQQMQTQVAQQVQTGINQAISAMQLQQPNIMPQPQQVFIRQPIPPHV